MCNLITLSGFIILHFRYTLVETSIDYFDSTEKIDLLISVNGVFMFTTDSHKFEVLFCKFYSTNLIVNVNFKLKLSFFGQIYFYEE